MNDPEGAITYQFLGVAVSVLLLFMLINAGTLKMVSQGFWK